MFLTVEQINQLQGLCEKVASNHTRTGRITLEIRNNMPRYFDVEEPVFDENHVEIGSIMHRIRVALPEEELRRGRQKNRLKPNGGKFERG
jgi:hypothetical protein